MSIPTIQGLAGILTEPKLDHTPQGKPVLKLFLGFSDRKYNDQSREWETSKSFVVDAAVWEDAAERLAPILAKGDQVYVEGRLETQSWEQDGQKRSKPALTVRTIRKLEKAPQQTQQGGFGNQQQSGGFGNSQQSNWGAPTDQQAAQNFGALGGQQAGGWGQPGRGCVLMAQATCPSKHAVPVPVKPHCPPPTCTWATCSCGTIWDYKTGKVMPDFKPKKK